MITDYPAQFFLALFILSVGLGAWLDRIVINWRIRRLQSRIELQRLEIQMLSGSSRRI